MHLQHWALFFHEINPNHLVEIGYHVNVIEKMYLNSLLHFPVMALMNKHPIY